MSNSATIVSLDRVMKDHAPQLEGEIMIKIPKAVRALGAIPFLDNDVVLLKRGIKLPDGDVLFLEPLFIDELDERFPCCRVDD